MNCLTRTLATLPIVVLVSGCVVGSNYKRPLVATPTDYRGATAAAIAPGPSTALLGAQK